MASCSSRRCPSIRAATKTHVGVLLALLAVLKAGDYWLDRFELTNAQTGIVQGATYSVVRGPTSGVDAADPDRRAHRVRCTCPSRRPVRSVRRSSPRRSGCSCRSSVASIYPAIIQGLVVNPDQESQGIRVHRAQRRRDTSSAYGLTDVDVRDDRPSTTTVTASDVEATSTAIDNVRLLNPTRCVTASCSTGRDVPELTINDLDVDRDSSSRRREDTEQVLRRRARTRPRRHPEPQLAGPAPAQHPRLRHGARAGRTRSPPATSRPAYRSVDLERPELYFSPSRSPATPSPTPSRSRRQCDEPHEYEGDTRRRRWLVRPQGGVRTRLPRLQPPAVGRDQGRQPDAVGPRRQRPSREARPVPVLRRRPVPGGASTVGVNWVIDAYTTTSRYPYSESIGDVGLSRSVGAVAERQLRPQQRQGRRRRLHG